MATEKHITLHPTTSGGTLDTETDLFPKVKLEDVENLSTTYQAKLGSGTGGATSIATLTCKGIDSTGNTQAILGNANIEIIFDSFLTDESANAPKTSVVKSAISTAKTEAISESKQYTDTEVSGLESSLPSIYVKKTDLNPRRALIKYVRSSTAESTDDVFSIYNYTNETWNLTLDCWTTYENSKSTNSIQYINDDIIILNYKFKYPKDSGYWASGRFWAFNPNSSIPSSFLNSKIFKIDNVSLSNGSTYLDNEFEHRINSITIKSITIESVSGEWCQFHVSHPAVNNVFCIQITGHLEEEE